MGQWCLMRKGLRATEDWPHAGQRKRSAREMTVPIDLREPSPDAMGRRLFITQRVDGVLPCGTQGGIKCADAAADDSHQKRN